MGFPFDHADPDYAASQGEVTADGSPIDGFIFGTAP